MMQWKRTLRTASSERFLLLRDGQEAAAGDLHYLASGTVSNSVSDESQNSVTKPAARKCPLCVNASVSPRRRITANET